MSYPGQCNHEWLPSEGRQGFKCMKMSRGELCGAFCKRDKRGKISVYEASVENRAPVRRPVAPPRAK